MDIEKFKLTAQELKWNKNLLLFYFLYTTLQGALRKWVFNGVSGVSDTLLIVQLIMPFIIVFAMKREKTIFSCKPLVPYALLLIAMALNPMNQTIFHGIFGFIIHMGFWFIMLMYLHEREAFPIENLRTVFLVFIVVESLLSFTQFQLPYSHFLNRYENSGSQDDIASFAGGGVRVVGTFSYISGFGSYLFFAGLFVWAMMVEKKMRVLFILIITGMGLVASFMNGSRAVLVPYIMCAAFGFLSYGSISQKIKSIALVGALAVLSIVFNFGQKLTSIGKSFDSISERIVSGQQSGEANNRTAKIFEETFNFSGNYPLLGIGLGATYQGATNKWGKAQELIHYGYVEEEPGRILMEGGYLLLIVRTFLFVMIAIKMKIPIIFSAPILFYMFFFTIFMFNAYQIAYAFLGLTFLDKVYYKQTEELAY